MLQLSFKTLHGSCTFSFLILVGVSTLNDVELILQFDASDAFGFFRISLGSGGVVGVRASGDVQDDNGYWSTCLLLLIVSILSSL